MQEQMIVKLWYLIHAKNVQISIHVKVKIVIMTQNHHHQNQNQIQKNLTVNMVIVLVFVMDLSVILWLNHIILLMIQLSNVKINNANVLETIVQNILIVK